MVEREGRIGIEIKLPISVAETVAAIAQGRDDQITAVELIEQLVIHAAQQPRKRRVHTEISRPLETLTGGETCLMLSLRASGYSAAEIATQFGLSAADTERHFDALDQEYRTKRSGTRRRGGIAA